MKKGLVILLDPYKKVYIKYKLNQYMPNGTYCSMRGEILLRIILY